MDYYIESNNKQIYMLKYFKSTTFGKNIFYTL